MNFSTNPGVGKVNVFFFAEVSLPRYIRGERDMTMMGASYTSLNKP